MPVEREVVLAQSAITSPTCAAAHRARHRHERPRLAVELDLVLGIVSRHPDDAAEPAVTSIM
jgi:hypothetical protein